MNSNSYQLTHNSKIFIGLILVILILGVTMVFSSSYIFAKETFGNSFYYFYRQLLFVGVGGLIAFLISKTKIQFWVKYGYYINNLCTLLIFLTFIPGIGITVKGAHRWINLGFMTFQPGEILRYSLILTAVTLFDDWNSLTTKDKTRYALSIFAPLIFLVLQPDFGSFTIGFLVLSCVCFLSTFPRKYFYSALASGLLISIPILISQPYRVKRLFAFLDPWKAAQTTGFQVIQSYLAFANGSIFGQGLGNSNEKLFYLPEAHNDFIFSVIGEEMGFIGVAFVIALFILFIYHGFLLALKMTNRKTFLTTGTIIFTIGLQALLNMGVVLGLLPTKGLNLPFISSGGSSMISNAFAIGLILAAVRSEKKKVEAMHNGLGSYSSSTESYINTSSQSGFQGFLDKTREL